MTIDLTPYLDTHGASNSRSYNGAMMDKGKVGENVILRWLRACPDVIEVEDFREARILQKADVDFGIYNHDTSIMFAEVKTDHHLKEGGNILFEYLRINHTAQPGNACVLGWTARTPAKLVIFYAPKEQRAYVIEAKVMRWAFQKHTSDNRPSKSAWFNTLPQMNMIYVSTDNIKSTLSCCIPWPVFPPKSIHAYDVSEYV